MKFEYKCLKNKSNYAFKIEEKIYYIDCKKGYFLKDMKDIINWSNSIEEMINWFYDIGVEIYKTPSNEEMEEIFEEKKWKNN